MKTKTLFLFAIGLALCGWTYAVAAGAGDEPTDIALEDSPIDAAINTLAQMAGMNIHIDQKITTPTLKPDGSPNPLTKVTIKWKNITPNNAFTALLDNYGYQAITDPKTGVTRVMIKDPNAQEPLRLKTIQLKYASPTNVASILKVVMSTRAQIQSDLRTSMVVLWATDSDLTAAAELLAKLDTPTQQILIEAQFLETTKNPTSIKGIDWTGTLSAQNFAIGNGITSGTTTTTTPGTTTTTKSVRGDGTIIETPTTAAYNQASTLSTVVGGAVAGTGIPGISADSVRGFYPHMAFLSADGLKAALSFLNTDSDTESISTPRAVTQDGVATELSVVRNIPVFEQQQGSSAGGVQQASTVKPNYDLKSGSATLNEVGVKLIVTPRVLGMDRIMLDLKPEISDVSATTAKATLDGKVNESPIFIRQKLITTATVPSGNTLVMGGLVRDVTSKGYTKVPLLGDLPLVGLAFRKDSRSRSKDNLIIFVTPTIVRDSDFQAPTPQAADFLKMKQKDKIELEEPAWDTGKPLDKNRTLF